METLKHIWEIIAPYFSGGVAGAIIGVIIIPFLKGTITKTTAKLNIDALLEKQDEAIENGVNKAVDRVKDITFKQSIQPLVESELKKVGEAANAQVADSVKSIRESNAAVLAAMKALGAYFDDSTVSEEKKAAFHEIIESAEKACMTEVETYAEIDPVQVARKDRKRYGGTAR